jgi:hypothetical protein
MENNKSIQEGERQQFGSDRTSYIQITVYFPTMTVLTSHSDF